MLCSRPFKQGVMEYGCGQCLPCRINRRRTWTSRLLLEAQQHPFNVFLTLTYSDENFPHGGSVVPRDLQLFLKRLRRRIAPSKVRFFGVGEYGGTTFRPHYHVLLFGVACPHGVDIDHRCQCDFAKDWAKGHVQGGGVTKDSASYVVEYTCKLMSKEEREEYRLSGRHPEFARMSLRPGIGAGAVRPLGAALVSKEGARHISQVSDVPSVVRQDGRLRPIGRYLHRKLREEVGMAAVMSDEAKELLAREKQAELLQPGAVQRREEIRQQHGRTAQARVQIARSKKGVGL